MRRAATKYLTADAGRARPRQDGVRRDLRALPFQQGAEARRRASIPAGCAGPGYLQCWNNYWAWTKTDDYKQQMRAIVDAPDFLDDNYLSTEVRVPVTLLQTNACSPLATNALAGNIWDNFSSQSYKTLPSVGTITVHDPFTGEPCAVRDAGGRARLHAAAVADQPVVDGAVPAQQHASAPFEQDPSVDARMRVFQASIEQMLWPEKREQDPVLGDKVPGDRSTAPTARSLITHSRAATCPRCCGRCAGRLHAAAAVSCSTRTAASRSGRFPNGHAGQPARQPAAAAGERAIRSSGARHVERAACELLVDLKLDLLTLPADATRRADARRRSPIWREPLLALEQMPGLRGQPRPLFRHRRMIAERDRALSDDDKRALIEFLKTF